MQVLDIEQISLKTTYIKQKQMSWPILIFPTQVQSPFRLKEMSVNQQGFFYML